MAIKFLQEKEKQEAMIYTLAFVVILTALIHFVGVDFNFEQPKVAPEGRGNFLEIKKTLDRIEEHHDFTRFRSFAPIPPFDGTLGRTDLFNINGINIANDPQVTEKIEDQEVIAD